MKITSFGPQVVVKDLDPVIDLFKDLGFEMHHNQQNVEGREIDGIVMKDSNGFRMNIVKDEKIPMDSLMEIRMNVDDFDEACDFLASRGFAPPKGVEVVNSGSAKALPMVSPSGFMILVVHHIKNHN
ncbi:hypothetical protein [Oribacterium sp. WCC10]|uniref:hypothetical protein n=1 Tax=Oribacterium sp. WCC10 TaxID=1855343 RepID=UPI0008F36CC6|nr:hypothetical protein [Oribacterium sp. WCC10]SFG65571.1 hypothetical protein SAMN05216356_11747 [Oribacterium sp. WCC10]